MSPTGNQVLPYQWGVQVQSVVAYDTATNSIAPVASGNWTLDDGSVILSPSSLYPPGTAYTVEYLASPVMVAYRSAGGVAHVRPFAEGRAAIPRRFHVMALDAWTRNRTGGELPGSGPLPPTRR